MTDEGGRKPRRPYRPEVEGLEGLRMYSGLAGLSLPVPADFGPIPSAEALPEADPGLDSAAWDAALDLSGYPGPAALEAFGAEPDTGAIRDGLSQLDRYLASSWHRAGLAPHTHDDCTQAVYLTLLDQLSRPGFDTLVAAVGLLGIREVFTRERLEGTLFFRAIDATKKRAQRERKLPSLDDGTQDPSAPGDHRGWSEALNEGIDRALTPREADLIRATLAGESLTEIADRWGVASKTVSNEKTRAFHKLRAFLSDEAGPAEDN